MYLTPYFVEDVEVGFHLWGEKVELAVFFTGRGYEPVPLQGSNVMLRNSIVNVEGFGKPVDVMRLATQENDDPSPVWPASGPCKDIP